MVGIITMRTFDWIVHFIHMTECPTFYGELQRRTKERRIHGNGLNLLYNMSTPDTHSRNDDNSHARIKRFIIKIRLL